MAETQPIAPETEAATGVLFQDERRAQIVRRVLERGRADVGELASEFGVTGETIRRDLTELQRERLVRRVHGGAVPWRGSVIVPRLEVREGHNAAEKRRIAKAASAEVPQTGSIIIDSGSTALQLADVLDRERELVVVTNQVSIVRSLSTTERPDVIVLGGALRRRTMAFVDETGVDTLRDMAVDVAFIGCDGMSPAHGFTTPYREEVAIKQAMIAAARRVVMMFDHTKVGNEQLFRFADVDEVDVIYTDDGMDPAVAALIEERGPSVNRV